MRATTNKRLLCLILAVEMLCAPLAMARVQDPAAAASRWDDGWEEVVPEIPLGEETDSADITDVTDSGRDSGSAGSAATLADVDTYYYAAVSFGQENTGTASPELTRYNGHFRPEIAESQLASWGVRTTDRLDVAANGDGSITITGLPTLEELGRLPGLEPDGYWYLYPGVSEQTDWWDASNWGSNPGQVLKGWSFDETAPEKYQRFAAVSEDGTATISAADFQSWMGYYHSEFFPDDGWGAFQEYYIPLVAGWKVSGRRDITLFTLETTEEGTGAVTSVTDLYTKPFRQAGAGDHLAAEAYGPVEYLVPQAEDEYRSEAVEFGLEHAFRPAAGQTEFYLRVAEEQEKLTLRFQTYEPYYAYNIAQDGEGESPVVLSASFNGGALEGVKLERCWDGLNDQPVFPRSVPVRGGAFLGQNSPQIPARAQWSAVDIPLSKVSQAANPNIDPFTTVTVTVAAPDGINTATYTFYIERLMTPNATLGYGNTPVGVIRKDTTGNWGNGTAAEKAENKEKAIASFLSSHYLGRAQDPATGNFLVPGGVFYRGEFSNLAWQGFTFHGQDNYNVDADPNAVVVYQDRAFSDPGVTFQDSEGRKVVFGGGAEADYQSCVTRTIVLSTPAGDASLNPSAAGEKCWYTVDENGRAALTTDESKAPQVLHNADGSDVVDLRGLKVLPGIYTMTYTFRDPVLNGEPLTIERPLVVLPIPGDVDMDGAVTIADAQLIDDNKDPDADIWRGSSQLANLYTYRVMNVRQNDLSGATAIRNGFRPAVAELTRTDYFYPILPVEGSTERYQRKTWDAVEDEATGATLRLEFLGVEKGTWQIQNGDLYTNDISGPWEADQEKGASITPSLSAVTSGTGDVFWMGVYLENAGALAGQRIEQLSLSLTYDSQYVRPARVHGFGEAAAQIGDDNKWRVNTLISYNFLERSKHHGVSMTTFSGMTGSDYNYSFSTPSRAYERYPHYSKVIGDLEQNYTSFDQLNVNYLKEAVFSLQGSSISYQRATLDSGEYLLVLPFQLIKHPGSERVVGKNGEAQLIELAAGMRDFTLVTRSTGRALPGASAAQIQWMASMMDVPVALAAAGTQTYAFSAQDAIYGGDTQNLRDTFTYESNETSAETGLIPLGEDRTKRTEIPKGEYDKQFNYTNLDLTEGTLTDGELPPGLTLNNVAATISGVPTKAGTYTFTIKGIPYTLTIEKKLLHYTANSQESYYGQEEFRCGDGERYSDDFTLSFTLADLAQRDRDHIRLHLPDNATAGSGDALAQALTWEAGVTYQAPTFRAMESDGTAPVSIHTGRGSYRIRVYGLPEATNYTFQYTGDSAGTNGSYLTILRRPVWVDHLEVPQDRSGARIYNDQGGVGVFLSIEEKKGEEFVIFTTRPADYPEIGESGMYRRLPLSEVGRVEGDRLTLTYVANYQQNENDLKYQQATGGDKITYPFYMEAGEEMRNLRRVSALNIRDPRITDWLSSDNYELVDSTRVLSDSANNIEGTVIRRGVQEIHFDTYPSILNRNEDGTPIRTARYGDMVNDHYTLRVSVTRGGMADTSDGEAIVGSYPYNAPDLQPMEIHYNWVSPEQKEAGEKGDTQGEEQCTAVTNWNPVTGEDLLPYNATAILTPAMDGYYLCAAVKKYEAGEDGEQITYIKAYSKYPVRVVKQELRLTVPTHQRRYYGEEARNLSYTYRFNDLVGLDRQWVQQYVDDYNQDKPYDQHLSNDSQAALEALLNAKYAGDDALTLPTLAVSTVNGIPEASQVANEYTPVAPASYLVLYGGASAYYDFCYGAKNAKDFGSEQYTIDPRPIVVSDIFSNDQNIDVIMGEAPGEGLHKTHFDAIYADAKNLYLKNNTADPDHAAFTLPAQDTDGTYYYYRANSAGNRIDIPAAQAFQRSDAVLERDREKLAVKYSIRFIPDQSHYNWNTFTNNYYSVEDLNNQHDDSGHKGTAQKKVEICDLTLAGDALTANNYILVYKTMEGSVYRTPAQVIEKNYPAPDPENPGYTRPYQVCGSGTVTLRPISSMTFDSLSLTEYNYGDPYDPEQVNQTTGEKMVVRVHYETVLDERHNDMANAYEGEPVQFNTIRLNATDRTSTFAQRGFTIYYLKAGAPDTLEAKQDAITNGQTIDWGDAMLPGEHNGARIFVVGQRRATDKPMISETAGKPLTVTPRPLRIQTPDGHKFYGEPNPTDFEDYTFSMTELAPRDREKLAELKGLGSANDLSATGKQSDLELLSGLAGWGFGTPVPRYTTTAVRTSTVGDYPLNMEMTGDFTNYAVTVTPGTLYVYPRPVTIKGVSSSREDPVYTIYNQSSTIDFRTQLDTSRVELTASNEGTGALTWPVTGNDNIPRNLPLSGGALVGDDSLIFNVNLHFYNQGSSTWDLGSNATDDFKPQVRAEFTGLTQRDVNANYKVANADFSTDGLWGAIKLRTIDHIVITSSPKMIGYTYGDSLDLSGLVVEVIYKTKGVLGQVETATVRYLGAEQFRSYGLYANYWDPEQAPPTEDDDRHALPTTYRHADTGDHITIAPTQDSRAAGRPFAANGKTLIISAFQDSTQGTQPAAEPLVLKHYNNNTGRYDYGAPQTIHIDPLPLRYTLEASDKTYDGTTRAAGTLVLQNIFDRNTQVKVNQYENNGVISVVPETAHVTDDVYIPMGSAARPQVVNGTATFTTGTYDGTHQAASILHENAQIAWTAGYTWGDGLTFTFANPNVHYLEEGEALPRAIGTEELAAYWRTAQAKNTPDGTWDFYREVCGMPVEVTGMVLAGEDAANYTWEADKTANSATSVTMTTRAAQQNGQAAAPYGIIHKANRPALQGRCALPTLAVDIHTNAIRLGLTQGLEALYDGTDEFNDELHFEYALFYDKDGIFTTWAGTSGSDSYQDTYFFGGETVRPTVEAGYQPDLERLPKEEDANERTVYKGQLYPWAGEDEGIVLDPTAYPGGVEAADRYRWYYSLYTTQRQPLPRNTVFYPLIRLSETHNYNPSGGLSGDERVTATHLEDAKAATAALEEAPEDEALKADALAASAVVLSDGADMKTAAEKAAAGKVEADRERAEANGQEQEEATDLPLSAAGIKTFTQRLDLISASRERNNVGEDRTTEYLVEMLEAVWFTDTLRYEDSKLMDSVVGNRPTRYHGYYWDIDRSAQLRFNKDEIVDLTGDILVSIRPRNEEEREVNVNPADETGARAARIYVSTQSGSVGSKVRSIRIVPSALYVRLGDDPYLLGVVTDPPRPSNRQYKWTSSDPGVATVDVNGLVTFRGVGETTITVATDNNHSASILVVVSAVLPVPDRSYPLFNYNFSEPWEELNGNNAFRPKEEMTRAQLTVLMDIFLNPNASWTATAELAYVDVTGRERYYEALTRLTGAGVVKGVPGQAFAGEQLVTRAEFAAILCRMLQLEVPDTAGQVHIFEDSGEKDTWAYAYIDAIAKTGVMRGVGGGDFAPERPLTREESAAVIARLLVTKLTAGQENLKIPTDMTPANWSYNAVLRSINAIAFPDAGQ